MKIAVCSDELYAINDFVINELKKRGHEVICFGALRTRQDASWAKTAREAAQSIINKECDEGIFFCYTATGIAMAANKIAGIRAALCSDAETARLARIWNHANVLALANRTLSEDIAKEILTAWFETPFDQRGKAGVLELWEVDQEFRSAD